MKTVGVILAGGRGVRAKLEIPKQLFKVKEVSVLDFVLRDFEKLHADGVIDQFIVVANADYFEEIKSTSEKYNGFAGAVPGGLTRNLSMLNAVRFLESELEGVRRVVFQDGVRVTTPVETYLKVLAGLEGFDTVTTAKKVTGNIARVDGNLITETLPRDRFVIGQAPTAYRFGSLKRMFDFAVKNGLVDEETGHEATPHDIGLAVEAGLRVGYVAENSLNLKITTPEDIEVFRALVRGGFKDFGPP